MAAQLDCDLGQQGECDQSFSSCFSFPFHYHSRYPAVPSHARVLLSFHTIHLPHLPNPPASHVSSSILPCALHSRPSAICPPTSALHLSLSLVTHRPFLISISILCPPRYATCLRADGCTTRTHHRSRSLTSPRISPRSSVADSPRLTPAHPATPLFPSFLLSSFRPYVLCLLASCFPPCLIASLTDCTPAPRSTLLSHAHTENRS